MKTARAPLLVDLFCGVGGWTKAFLRRGWTCIGVDLARFDDYPGTFLQMDARTVPAELFEAADAIVASPPCEEFARAWLPWLRGDHTPSAEAIGLLAWSIELTANHPRRITECSVFAGKHAPGGTRFGSYILWGDVPILMPHIPRRKANKSGLRPDLRAEIPPHLADWIAHQYTKTLEDSRRPGGRADHGSPNTTPTPPVAAPGAASPTEAAR